MDFGRVHRPFKANGLQKSSMTHSIGAAGSNSSPGSLEVEVPDAVANRWYRDPKIDTIGPGRFASESQLPELNAVMTGLAAVKSPP